MRETRTNRIEHERSFSPRLTRRRWKRAYRRMAGRDRETAAPALMS
jgi:hypothetical protein